MKERENIMAHKLREKKKAKKPPNKSGGGAKIKRIENWAKDTFLSDIFLSHSFIVDITI